MRHALKLSNGVEEMLDGYKSMHSLQDSDRYLSTRREWISRQRKKWKQAFDKVQGVRSFYQDSMSCDGCDAISKLLKDLDEKKISLMTFDHLASSHLSSTRRSRRAVIGRAASGLRNTRSIGPIITGAVKTMGPPLLKKLGKWALKGVAFLGFDMATSTAVDEVRKHCIFSKQCLD